MKRYSPDMFAEPQRRRSPAIARALWPLMLPLALVGALIGRIAGPGMVAVVRHFTSRWFFLYAALWGGLSYLHYIVYTASPLLNWMTLYRELHAELFLSSVDWLIAPHPYLPDFIVELYRHWVLFSYDHLIFSDSPLECLLAALYLLWRPLALIAAGIFVSNVIWHAPRSLREIIG